MVIMVVLKRKLLIPLIGGWMEVFYYFIAIIIKKNSMQLRFKRCIEELKIILKIQVLICKLTLVYIKTSKQIHSNPSQTIKNMCVGIVCGFCLCV